MDEKGWIDYCIELRKAHPVVEELFCKKQLEGKVGVSYKGGRGGIPVLTANGVNLPEAWENSMIALAARGMFLRTQYDKKDKQTGDYIEPMSLDCTMHTIIEQPSAEPRIHRAFPGGLEDLEEYRQEVLDGIKDHWVRDQTDPKDERWEYTYHQRMFKYEVPGVPKAVNQFEVMAGNIAKSPITRRAQMITWKVWEDIAIGDPACLQSFWGRCGRAHPDASPDFDMYCDENRGKLMLNLNWRFRSRDAYDAAFMNNFALVLLGEKLALKIAQMRGEPVELSRAEDNSDSYHIYGRRLQHFYDNFVAQLESRHFYEKVKDDDTEARTWHSDGEMAQAIFGEARNLINVKVAEQDAKYAQGIGMTKDSTQLLKKEE